MGTQKANSQSQSKELSLTNVFLLLIEFGKERRRFLTFLCGPDSADRLPEAEVVGILPLAGFLSVVSDLSDGLQGEWDVPAHDSPSSIPDTLGEAKLYLDLLRVLGWAQGLQADIKQISRRKVCMNSPHSKMKTRHLDGSECLYTGLNKEQGLWKSN